MMFRFFIQINILMNFLPDSGIFLPFMFQEKLMEFRGDNLDFQLKSSYKIPIAFIKPFNFQGEKINEEVKSDVVQEDLFNKETEKILSEQFEIKILSNVIFIQSDRSKLKLEIHGIKDLFLFLKFTTDEINFNEIKEKQNLYFEYQDLEKIIVQIIEKILNEPDEFSASLHISQDGSSWILSFFQDLQYTKKLILSIPFNPSSLDELYKKVSMHHFNQTEEIKKINLNKNYGNPFPQVE